MRRQQTPSPAELWGLTQVQKVLRVFARRVLRADQGSRPGLQELFGDFYRLKLYALIVKIFATLPGPSAGRTPRPAAAVPEGYQDHGRIQMAVAVGLSRLDQGLDSPRVRCSRVRSQRSVAGLEQLFV